MERIYSQGKTLGQIAYPNGSAVSFSILSHRAARLAIKLSAYGEWRTLVFPYEPIGMGRLIFVGFQPETGRHLAVFKIFRKGR